MGSVFSNPKVDILKCQFCPSTLESPIILPCGKTICEAHVQDFLSKDKTAMDQCPCCDKSHEVPEDGFSKNIHAEFIQKAEITEKQSAAKKTISELETYLNDIDKFLKDPDNYIYNHIQEVRYKIDEKAEKDIQDTKEQKEDMHQKLDQFEKECRGKTKEFIEKEDTRNSVLYFGVVKEFNEWNEKVNRVSLQDYTSDEIMEEAAKTKMKVDVKWNELKSSLLQNKHCDFASNLLSADIGKLHICDPFLVTFLGARLTSDLFQLIGFVNACDDWILIYQGSAHGFTGANFHSKCDKNAKTLTIIKSTEPYIFGAYTDVAWDSSGACKHDPNAFIFSLTNPKNKPAVFKANGGSSAINCNSSYGPTFGSNSDLYISANAHSCNSSYSNLGGSYINTNHSNYGLYLVGKQNFQISDVVVLRKK